MFRRLTIILSIGAILLTWGLLDGPAVRQQRGIKAAEVLQNQLEPLLAADPRFASVEMMITMEPNLRVIGKVADEAALRDLKRIVILPPDANFRLSFNVAVDPSASTRPVN